MVKILTLILVSTLLCPRSYATEDFTLYFVRHAEKKPNNKNPTLTLCGSERANQLARLLGTTNIKSIYSTNYQRTMSTAAPLSKKTNLAIKSYSPKHLNKLSLQLINRHETALIVGHSNTTPQLVRLLTNEKIEDIAEDEYQIIYQLHFVHNKPFLTTLIQPLTCD